MKKFNFLSVFYVALFLFLGLSASAQYKPLPESIQIVNQTVTQLSQTTQIPGNGVTTLNGQQLSSQSGTNAMRIMYGNALLSEFKQQVSVSQAFVNVNQKLNLSNSGRQQLMLNAETYYKNLLKI
jgi:parvulin-like peptidyl-prolyl isomerase